MRDILELSTPELVRLTGLKMSAVAHVRAAAAGAMLPLPADADDTPATSDTIYAASAQSAGSRKGKRGREGGVSNAGNGAILGYVRPTALSLLEGERAGKSNAQHRVTLGDAQLDAVLGGGILTHVLTEFSGVSGAGKTQLALQLAIHAQRPVAQGGLGAATAYVCTEAAFPARRLAQMAAAAAARAYDGMPHINDDASSSAYADNVYVEHADTIEQLQHVVGERVPYLMRHANVRVVVIDSIAALFRVEYAHDQGRARAAAIVRMAQHLKALASTFGAAVVCLNQVTANITSDTTTTTTTTSSTILGSTYNGSGGGGGGGGGGGSSSVRPALGLAWSSCVNMRLVIARRESQRVHLNGGIEGVVRDLQITLAPHLPLGECQFVVDGDGVHAWPEYERHLYDD